MKKTLFVAMLLSAAFGAHASTDNALSGTLEYSHSNIDFDDGPKLKFDGAALGLSTSPHNHGYWGKFEYAENSKSDSSFYDASFGLHRNLLSKDGFYLNGLAGIGYTRIDSGITNSNLNFITLPIGVEAGFSVTKFADVFASAGYKWMFDTTGRNGYFDNGRSSMGSSNNDPNKYPDKVVCENGFWYEGSSPSLCANSGGVVATERDKILCNDGTWREGAVNSGTCTASGGIVEKPIKDGSLNMMQAQYGNAVSFGDAETPTFKIGLRVRF